LETLRIKNFLGINKKADPSDIDEHSCQTLDGFDVSLKPGALVKRKGMTDQANVNLPASYPTGWTIKNFFRFNVNKPSAKTITIVHATVGGLDKVFVDWTYSGSAWVNAWVDLTEQEEGLTTGAGSNTTTIICSALSSSTDDYYNGWVINNLKDNSIGIVTNYVGSSKTITCTTMSGQTNGETFNIYRYNLISQTDSLYARSGSNTTTAIDFANYTTQYFQLRDDYDDAYNGWIVHNSTVGDTALILPGTKENLHMER
jgi:hypothetical protein